MLSNDAGLRPRDGYKDGSNFGLGQGEAAERDLSAARQHRGTIDEDVKEAGFMAADGLAMAPPATR